MSGLSSLGIALAVISSLLFLALIAELYYIFWWKKKKRSCISISNSNSNSNSTTNSNSISNNPKKFMSCFKNNAIDLDLDLDHSPPPSHTITVENDPITSKDSLLKATMNGGAAAGGGAGGEEAIDAELMRLHSLSGPPRFLFTIKEETREDLESDDGRSRGQRSRKGSRGRSLGDFLHCAESPLLTPLSSPPLLGGNGGVGGVGAHMSLVNFESLKKLGFNPLFESSNASPPPKFQFLKEAEEKLQRRIGLLERSRGGGNGEDERRRNGQVTVTITPPSSLSPLKSEKY